MFAFLLLALSPAVSAEPSLETAMSSIDAEKCSWTAPCQGDAEGVSFKVVSKNEIYFSAPEKWYLFMRIDPFSDLKICSLQTDKSNRNEMRYEPELYINIIGKRITFNTYHFKKRRYPGSMEMYRVDQNTTIYQEESKITDVGTSNLLIKQMQKGSSMLIAFESWPEQFREPQSIDLKGFTAIYKATVNACDHYGKS